MSQQFFCGKKTSCGISLPLIRMRNHESWHYEFDQDRPVWWLIIIFFYHDDREFCTCFPSSSILLKWVTQRMNDWNTTRGYGQFFGHIASCFEVFLFGEENKSCTKRSWPFHCCLGRTICRWALAQCGGFSKPLAWWSSSMRRNFQRLWKRTTKGSFVAKSSPISMQFIDLHPWSYK